MKGFVFESYGARVGLKSNTNSILEAMKDRLPPASKLIDSGAPTCFFSIIAGDAGGERNGKCAYQLYRRRRLLRQTGSLDGALDELESRLPFAVALESSPGLFVHAGVVGWNHGAIVIPGCSGSGKSTLVAALVSAGADYYSDEYAVFDQHGYVHAYPKPLFLREPYDGRSGKCSAAELGGRSGTNPMPVKLVVATRYDETAHWQPRILSPGQAVLRLLENTVRARKRAQCAIDIVARVAAGSLAIGGDRPSWDQVVPSLLALCGGGSRGVNNERRLRSAQHSFAPSRSAAWSPGAGQPQSGSRNLGADNTTKESTCHIGQQCRTTT